LWNIAGDHEINLRLKEAGFKVWKQACCDERFSDMTAEEIYEILRKENEEDKKNGQKGRHGEDGDPVPGLGEDMREPENMTPEEVVAETQRIKTMVAQAATMAKQAGQMSAGLERFVHAILHPTTPWWDQLTLLAKRVVREDESWLVKNRRFDKIYLPGYKSYRLGKIVLINDTSGSISDRDLKLYNGIAMDVFDELRPESMDVIWWDYEFQGRQEFGPGERPELRAVGGGGTAMDRALKYVEDEYVDPPAAVILITDCETGWPDYEMPYPLIVLSTTQKVSPIGTTIHVSA
jgi:predicted metal-dependent peptidase